MNEYQRKQLLINLKTNEIINNLNLIKSDETKIQLDNCCKLQKYIVLNNNYDYSIIKYNKYITPEEVITTELYNCLINKKAVCTTNSIMFTHILNKLNIEVYNVDLIHKIKKGYHMANIVKLGRKYYYFDTTWDNGLYNDGKSNCISRAGLGSIMFNYFFDIVRIYDNNFNLYTIKKEDISKKDISPTLTNKYKYQYKH